MLIHEQNYIAEHLGVSVPAEGNAQCLASAFPNSIQSVSLDPGALRDYPPPEFPREGKTYSAVRNVGGKKNVSSVNYLNVLEMREKECLRDQMETNVMSKNNCVVL